MAMDLGGAKGGVKSDINVTPLVDVMLVLLIIMMLIAPMLQQGVDVKLPDGDEHRRQARDAGPDGRRHRRRQASSTSTPSQVRRRRARRQGQRASSRTRRRRSSSSRPTRTRSTARSWRRWTQLRKAGIEDIGLITEKKEAPARGGRQVMAHAHKHFGAEKVVTRRDAARQRGHERHAAHRRAARAAGHLHGGPAAHAEGRRHQPAARDARRRQTATPDVSQIVLEYTADKRSRSTSRTSRIGELETRLRDIFEQRKDKTMFIVGDGDAALRRHRRGHRRGQGRRRREGRHRHRRHAQGRKRVEDRRQLAAALAARAHTIKGGPSRVRPFRLYGCQPPLTPIKDTGHRVALTLGPRPARPRRGVPVALAIRACRRTTAYRNRPPWMPAA